MFDGGVHCCCCCVGGPGLRSDWCVGWRGCINSACWGVVMCLDEGEGGGLDEGEGVRVGFRGMIVVME